MNRQAFASAYEPIPPALEYRVQYALAHLDDPPKPAPRLSLRTAVIALALLLALCGVAYAIYESITANLFGWFYGGSWKEDIQSGDFAPMGQSYRLGDVTYTIEEMVYKTQGDFQGLYGVVRIAPAQDANIVLLSDDVSVDDPAGVLLHYGDTGQTISDEDPSYAELAAQRGAKMIVARVAVNSISVNGQDCAVTCGEAWLPQPDGTLLGTMEIAGDLPRSDSYQLNLWVSNWQVTPEGEWLREEPDNTWLRYDWDLTVTPEMKGGTEE